MQKDPAFLFYSKDWLEGTAEMMPDEKGIYIDLLCHQHQKGSLPKDINRLAKISGLTEYEFLKIWEGVKSKFKIDGNRLVNHKLAEVVKDRKDHGKRNKIIGTFASVIRLSHIDYSLKNAVKKIFNWEDFLEISDENLTNHLNQWLTTLLKNGFKRIEDENESEDKDVNIKGGAGGILTREEELTTYQKYTDNILAKQDFYFEELTLKERIDVTEDAVKDHLALLCRYPNMQPLMPMEFRQSLIKHIKEFKSKPNGAPTKDEFLGTFNLTQARKTMEELRRLDEQERTKNNSGAEW